MFKELAKKKEPPPNASTQAKPEDTRLQFTKLSAKTGLKKTYEVGIRTGSEDLTFKLPGKKMPGRFISEVLAYMIPGGTHWWLEFVAGHLQR